jgi:hypothetical protein
MIAMRWPFKRPICSFGTFGAIIMNAVYLFAGVILSATANMTTIIDSDFVGGLMGRIVTVAEDATAKTEEIMSLVAPKPQLQIEGPPPPVPAPSQPKMWRGPPTGPRESFSADLDDEIPF